MDVAERRDSYVVLVELPGVNPAQVDLHFEQNVLTVSGTKQSAFDPSAHQEIRLFAAERANGEFSRAVRLPDVADADGISATFTNGLLTVTVPKATPPSRGRSALKSARSRRQTPATDRCTGGGKVPPPIRARIVPSTVHAPGD